MSEKIGSYIKAVLSNRGLNSKAAAELLHYEPQSMRNKFSRGTFNLHDILMVCLLNDASLVIRNKDGKDEYVFDLQRELTEEDFARYQRCIQSLKLTFADWFAEMQKKKRLGTNELVAVQPGAFEEKRKEGETEIESVNFFEPLMIVGERHAEAAKWLGKQNSSTISPEREFMNVFIAQGFFGVLVDFHAGLVPNCYAMRDK
ncbi:MAG: hypothetical protein IKO07_07445 [Clostridia bacterium]|nr:hypothetical protein [Clostridia bacterium]